MHFREPSFEFLMKIPPGRETCLELIRFRPPRPKPDPNLGFDPGEMRNKESFAQIEFNTDAIAVLPSETLEFYVSQADGTYLHCALNQ